MLCRSLSCHLSISQAIPFTSWVSVLGLSYLETHLDFKA